MCLETHKRGAYLGAQKVGIFLPEYSPYLRQERSLTIGRQLVGSHLLQEEVRSENFGDKLCNNDGQDQH